MQVLSFYYIAPQVSKGGGGIGGSPDETTRMGEKKEGRKEGKKARKKRRRREIRSDEEGSRDGEGERLFGFTFDDDGPWVWAKWVVVRGPEREIHVRTKCWGDEETKVEFSIQRSGPLLSWLMAKDEGIRSESEGQEVETRGQQGEREERESWFHGEVSGQWRWDYEQMDRFYSKLARAKGGTEKDSNFNRSQRVFLDRMDFYSL
jgi:hypothetical protein